MGTAEDADTVTVGDIYEMRRARCPLRGPEVGCHIVTVTPTRGIERLDAPLQSCTPTQSRRLDLAVMVWAEQDQARTQTVPSLGYHAHCRECMGSALDETQL